MDNSTIGLIGMGISAVGLSVGISSFLSSKFMSKANVERDRRLTILETKWSFYSLFLEKDLGNMLHSPHRKELDALIEKNSDADTELTREEAIKFVKLLGMIKDDPRIRPGEEVGANLLRASIASRYNLENLE